MSKKSKVNEVDVTQFLIDLDDKPIKTGRGPNDPDAIDLTLREALIEAVLLPQDVQGKSTTMIEKLELEMLARRIKTKDKVVFSVEEIVKIKERLNVRFSAPIIASQAARLIDSVLQERFEKETQSKPSSE